MERRQKTKKGGEWHSEGKEQRSKSRNGTNIDDFPIFLTVAQVSGGWFNLLSVNSNVDFSLNQGQEEEIVRDATS